MAVRTSSRFNPRPLAAVGFTWTRTAGRCPPLMLTRPTPLSWLIFCASRVSARSSTCVSGSRLLVSASVRMGVSAGLVLAYTGGLGRSVGR